MRKRNPWAWSPGPIERWEPTAEDLEIFDRPVVYRGVVIPPPPWPPSPTALALRRELWRGYQRDIKS